MFAVSHGGGHSRGPASLRLRWRPPTSAAVVSAASWHGRPHVCRTVNSVPAELLLHTHSLYLEFIFDVVFGGTETGSGVVKQWS
jgi:hypothetical protein